MPSNHESCIIGITGHRALPHGCVPKLAEEIRAFYKDMMEKYSAITVLSPLAEGADMLAAKLALDMGLRLIVPLPMNTQNYREGFSEPAAVGEFDLLLSLADRVFVVQPEETVPPIPQPGFFYRQAGIYVAKNCDILLAVWNGVERETTDGAGTWETIKLARTFGKETRILAPCPTTPPRPL